MLLQAVVAAADPASGGRQMPSHWGHRRLHIVSQSSPTGTQVLQAVGCAEAGMYLAGRARPPGSACASSGDEVVYVSLGEGATSEGEFWEALSTACVQAAAGPHPGGGQRLRDLGAGRGADARAATSASWCARFPNLHVVDVDGTDPLASYAACRSAVEYCRARRARRWCTRA